MIKKKYCQIRGQLKTGDLVLFSGTSLFSLAIRLSSKSRYSHVGVVLVLSGDVLLWESTKRPVEDHTGKPKKGVKLTTLSNRISDYEGDVYIRQLDEKLPADAEPELLDLRKELKDKPYEQDKLELFKAAHDGLSGANREEDLSSIFCSELVAEAYQCVGLLLEPPSGQPSNEYTPGDFGRMKQLENSYSLEEAIQVTP